MNNIILEKYGFCVGDVITLLDGCKNRLIIREIIHLRCDNKYYFVVEDFIDNCNEQKSICKMIKKQIVEVYEIRHPYDSINNSQVFTTNKK